VGERKRAAALVSRACDVFVARKRARDLDEVASWLRPRRTARNNARCIRR
jgi:hypothetical protein